MLACESKLVRFIFELNGLVSTDRHDWDVLWTHTTGKSYFYERLTKNQKVNHFPISIELTRKDLMSKNIKRMQAKYSKQYFSFVPDTFTMPEEYQEFIKCFDESET
jgi:tubulin polyglutamylase TTLL5